MTAFSFLLIQAPIPIKFFFLIGGVVVLIIGIIIFAYRSYIKSDDPTEDDLSALHIGTHAAVPPQPTASSPATRKQAAPVIQQTAKLSTPAPVENKIVAPPIVMTEAPAPPPVAPTRPAPPPPPPPVVVQQTRPLPPPNTTSMLTEELPSSAPRTLASPRVFSPTTPRQDAPAPIPPVAQITYAAAPEPQPPAPVQPYVEQTRASESTVFGSLTEGQKNQSKSNRFTLVILAVAVIVIFWVGFTKVPTIHDAVMSAYDTITGHNPPPPPAVQTPKIEIEQKVTLAGPILYVDGKVRNISDAPLENLYAEVVVLYTNGKLSETRLTPILAGAATATTAAQTGVPPKEDHSLPPSQNGRYKLEVPGATFHDAQLKRVLREDGTEVMFQKK